MYPLYQKLLLDYFFKVIIIFQIFNIPFLQEFIQFFFKFLQFHQKFYIQQFQQSLVVYQSQKSRSYLLKFLIQHYRNLQTYSLIPHYPAKFLQFNAYLIYYALDQIKFLNDASLSISKKQELQKPKRQLQSYSLLNFANF